MATIYIENGELIDSQGRRRGDVIIEGSKISQVGENLTKPSGAYVIDASDMVVTPGLVDIQVHFREPGSDVQESAEDIKSGSRAAAAGGVTAVQSMPNTLPCTDNPKTYLDVIERTKTALCDIFVSAAITKDRQSQEITDLQGLYQAGARTFTDDGDCVQSARVMREAIELLSSYDDCILAQHCEDHSLVHDGVMDEGVISAELGLQGRHRVAEEIIIARDIALMKAFASKNLRYHVLHLSTAQGAQVVREAKAQGMFVSTEVAPQHLALTSELLKTNNANFKMNPPLRTAEDNKALISGLVDGTIDVIATDHAPHAKELKDKGVKDAPPGMLGVETLLSVAITHLVKPGIMSLEDLIQLVSIKPARIINAHKIDELGRGGHGLDFVEGNEANIAIFNENESFILDAQNLHSKSVNSPWDGNELFGKVHYTIRHGEMVCEKGQPTS